MKTDNRAQRRKAAKASGVKGQVVAVLAVVSKPYSSVTLAGAVVGAIEALAKKGGAPYEHAVITVGSDHPEHPGQLVIEAKTSRMAKPATAPAIELGAPLAVE